MTNPIIVRVQNVLNQMGAKLRVDGTLGPKTIKAVNKSDETKRAAFNVQGFQVLYEDYTMREATRWIDAVSVNSIIDRVARETNVPVSYLKLVLSVEPIKRTVKGETQYDLYSGLGTSFRGLGQMSESAWVDATKKAKSLGLSLGSYKDKSFDAYESLLAAACFALFNKEVVADRYGYKGGFSDAQLYTMHNQGWSGYAYFALKQPLRFPDQSKTALQVFAQAKSDRILA